MSVDNNIKNYSAADIEKYHKGLLTSKERHDMEKAALDDPFLADALEGYTTDGVNISADIAELKERLQERTEEKKKVVPITKGGGGMNFFLRIAAIVIVVAGAGFFTYKFAFNKQNNTVAKTENGYKDPATEQEQPVPMENKPDSVKTGNQSLATTPTIDGIKEEAGSSKIADDEMTKDLAVEKPTEKSLPAAPPVIKKDTKVTATEREADLAKGNAGAPTQQAVADKEAKQEEASAVSSTIAGIKKPGNAKKKTEDIDYNMARNIFRGRVTDSSNNGVPFANVTNVEDNVGTYTDADGYFNLINPDTVLNVRVRSIGFQNNTTQLRNDVKTNKVILKEDHESLDQVVISNRQSNAMNRSLGDNRSLEEPEPADGWANYDTYIANNLNIPENIPPRPSRDAYVELSFEVDKNGEPINIKIEKSLCAKCDEEAKRLIKEGPRWKRDARKKGRTRVTVNF